MSNRIVRCLSQINVLFSTVNDFTCCQHRARTSDVDMSTYPWASSIVQMIKEVAVKFEIISDSKVKI